MFRKSPFSRLEPGRLRKLMWLFFLAMALPSTVLIYKSYDQLKWEAFYQHRQLAEDLSGRVDQQFIEFVAREESRPFSDYRFAVAQSNDSIIERSPLSTYPIQTDTPGVIGYFQIDASGRFSTPLLPSSPPIDKKADLSVAQLKQRSEAQIRVEEILSSNQLVEQRKMQDISDAITKPLLERFESVSGLSVDESVSNEGASPVDTSIMNQAAFDELSNVKKSRFDNKSEYDRKGGVLSRLEELELESPYKDKVGERKKEVSKQTASVLAPSAAEKSVKSREFGGSRQASSSYSLEEKLVQTRTLSDLDTPAERRQTELESDQGSGIRIFENEIDPFEISLLNSGHFVLYRKVWRDGQRYIQGLLLEQAPFIDGLISDNYAQSLLADMSTLTVIYQGNALSSFSQKNKYSSSRVSDSLSGTLLYRTRLSEPFNDLENVFTIRRLPAGPGGQVILWAAFIMALVLGIGCLLLYRMSLRNLSLVNQQQDFVSAVSHELKTPLTSIRMYGEMLNEGWADEKNKQGYYRYIFDESERLSRLINNILELARMTRNETPVDLKRISVAQLVDNIQSKIDSQIERSNFHLNLEIEELAAGKSLDIDPDVFAQVIINLVDNALKFSAKADKKVIDVSVTYQSDGKLCFAVRDYGPGVEKDQLKKIFELFYRTENELTRETTGTGIGLALVSQLTQLMKGEIDVLNRDTGAEFRLFFLAKVK